MDKPVASNSSARDTRATIIRVMTFLGGVYFFLYFLTPESVLVRLGIDAAHASISNGFVVVGSMAVGLGIVNIVMAHGAKVAFKKQGWGFSLTLLLGLVAMLGVTCAQWIRERAISSQVRKVQVIGDFAARILEDAKQPNGKPLSFSTQREFPSLSVRVAALGSFATSLLEQGAQERSVVGALASKNSALSAILSEVEQAEVTLQESLFRVLQSDWSTLTPERERALRDVQGHAARYASSYALLKRTTGNNSLINRAYEFLYNGLFDQLGAAMFALLGVYIAAAAYRAFRIQSIESALMMGAALVVMLGQISFGKILYQDMPALRQWLLEVPNSAAFRAIRLGAGVAGLMLAIRMWLSIESDAGQGRGEKR